MKLNKQMNENEQALADHPMNTVYENAPFDERTLSGDRTLCQDDTVKSFEKQSVHRPKLSAYAAINQIRGLLQRVDTDLSNSVDTIAHRELMKSIAWRINDAAMLALIEAWLDIAIEKATRKTSMEGSSSVRRNLDSFAK